MPRRVGWAGAGALALALATGCGGDRREAERAVRAYNEAAIHAYRTRDFGPLQKVATEKEWGRVVVLVDLKSASKLVLEAELQSLAVTKVERPSPEGMVVETRERWRYFDRSLEPGRPAGQVFVADMVLRYELERAKEGGWRMSRGKTLSTDYLEPKGFRLEGGRRAPRRPPRPSRPRGVRGRGARGGRSSRSA